MSAPRIFTPAYYDRMRALESGGWWNAAMRDVAGMLLERAGLPHEGTMVDVGCGSGQTVGWFLAGHPRWRGVGLDVALDGLRAAGQAGIDAFGASALALPLRDASVDLVITLDVVQHLPLGGGDVAALREMRRILRPGGWLLLRTNAQAFPRAADDAAYDFHKYEPDELRARLETAGFAVHRLSRVNALLGLAEVPREWRARRADGDGYHGLLAAPAPERPLVRAMKRGWLRVEGRAVRAGWRLPLGRTIVALCRAGEA